MLLLYGWIVSDLQGLCNIQYFFFDRQWLSWNCTIFHALNFFEAFYCSFDSRILERVFITDCLVEKLPYFTVKYLSITFPRIIKENIRLSSERYAVIIEANGS